VSPPAAPPPQRTRIHPAPPRPAPDRAGAKRPPPAGRALAGGFGPRPRRSSPHHMTPAMAGAKSSREGTPQTPTAGRNRKRTAFPRPHHPTHRQTASPEKPHRPAPDRAGEKRPPPAGRALAGGLWPPTGLEQTSHMTPAMAGVTAGITDMTLPRSRSPPRPVSAIYPRPARDQLAVQPPRPPGPGFAAFGLLALGH
jgi:hypothetical protein